MCSSMGNAGNASGVTGEVSYQQIIQASPNTITFSKNVALSPDGYMTESGRKKDLEKLIDKYNIKDVVMNTYNDKAGANDLKRMQDLGFKVKAHTSVKYESRPSKEYYYMTRS